MNNHRRQLGFTLIEMMITVAIVGILAAIAYPSYRDQVIKSNRTEGKVALQQAAVNLEKCYTRTMSYAGAACAPAAATEGGRYAVKVEAGATGVLATSYKLTATPQGPQADDKCGALTLTDAGVKGAAAANCW